MTAGGQMIAGLTKDGKPAAMNAQGAGTVSISTADFLFI